MNLPTKITFSRIIGIAFVFLTLVLHYIFKLADPSFVTSNIQIGSSNIDLFFLILFGLFVIISFTDMIDGKLARSRNEVTTLGKFLDPVADKLLVNTMLVFLAAPNVFAPYAVTQTAKISIWCVVIMIARDIIVDALRSIAAGKNVVIAANIFGKAKTVFQMVAIGVVLINGFPFSLLDGTFIDGLKVSDILVYLATIVSLLSGVIYVIQNKDVLKEN